jgi:integrase
MLVMGEDLVNSNHSSDQKAILLDALWRAGDILSAAAIKEYVILADESVREFGRDVNELRRLRATADERFLSAPRGQADKNPPKRARSFPFRVLPELEALPTLRRTQTDAERRRSDSIIPHVFHHAAGRPLSGSDQRLQKSIRRAWRRACVGTGLPGRIPHDFRRTAVRDLERACVPQSIAMELVGHKTESVYQRYDIVAERDLTDGVARYAAGLATTRVRQRLAG